MKRLLGILVASMFLASAAFAADAVKEEKKAETKDEKKARDTKVGVGGEEKKADEKKTDGKAKSTDTKGGATGEKKARDAKVGIVGEEKKAEEKKATK
jgi:opacity protein-like surface antigen